MKNSATYRAVNSRLWSGSFQFSGLDEITRHFANAS